MKYSFSENCFKSPDFRGAGFWGPDFWGPGLWSQVFVLEHAFYKNSFWKYTHQNFLTKSSKHMLHCFKQYNNAIGFLITRKLKNQVSK